MSGLFDGIENDKIRKGPRCGVAVLRDELPADDVGPFDKALLLPKERVPTVMLVRRLRGAGYSIQPRSIDRHRNGDCACENA